MNICMVTPYIRPVKSGTGDYSYLISKALAALGHSVYVITGDISEIRDFDYSPDGLRVYPVIEKWNTASFLKICGMIKNIKPEIIHIQYQSYSYGRSFLINLLPLLLRLCFSDKKVIVTLHDLSGPQIFGIENRAFERLLQACGLTLLMIFSHRFTVSNEPELSLIAKKYPALIYNRFIKHKLNLIPVGSNIRINEKVAAETAALLKEEYSIDKDDFLIAFFGFIRRGKGLDILFSSFKEILKEKNNCKLLIIGGVKEEDYFLKIKSLAQSLGIAEHVIYTGYIPQDKVSLLLEICDLCILPFEDGISTYRGSFAAVAVHGLPLIASLNRNLPQGLKDRFNLALVPPKDVAALSRAALELIASAGERGRLSRNLSVYAENFFWPNIAARISKLYEN